MKQHVRWGTSSLVAQNESALNGDVLLGAFLFLSIFQLCTTSSFIKLRRLDPIVLKSFGCFVDPSFRRLDYSHSNVATF